jgi:uncharacterized protein (DUF3820 family)
MNGEQNKTLMPFGKHTGQEPSRVPSDYLRWFLRTFKLGSGFRAALAAELASRGIAAPDPPAIAPDMPRRCSRCGSNDPPRLTWHQQRDARRAIRRTCGRCGSWRGTPPQTPANIAEADRNASPAPLLDVLTRLDDLGITLKSDGQAIHFATVEDWRRCPADLRDTIRQCNHQLATMLLRGRTT